MQSKQVLVIRKDLGMRKGKMIAQGAHASMKVFFDLATYRPDVAGSIPVYPSLLHIPMVSTEMIHWVWGNFTKVVVGVESEAALVDCYEKAKAAGLPCSLIEDIGATEFHGVPTKTAVAIGPADPKDIDPITGHLTLL